jgi:hypothetical protein
MFLLHCWIICNILFGCSICPHYYCLHDEIEFEISSVSSNEFDCSSVFHKLYRDVEYCLKNDNYKCSYIMTQYEKTKSIREPETLFEYIVFNQLFDEKHHIKSVKLINLDTIEIMNREKKIITIQKINFKC